MKNLYEKIAFFLIVLGAIPTLKEGFTVLLGNRPEGMIVLTWLVCYNVITAIFSLLIVYLLWSQSTAVLKFVFVLLFSHLIVFLYLVFLHFTNGMVAPKSVIAMFVRFTLWGIIALLVRKGLTKRYLS